LQPWIAGAADDVITISTDLVSGYRLVPSPAHAASTSS
jgi:hypothetical protein